MPPYLPYELILFILEFAYFPSSSARQPLREWTPDRGTLSSCTLVCNSWKDLAQRLLFHEVQWLSTSFPEALRAGNERAQTLGSYIRRLELRINGSTASGLTSKSFFAKDFLTILPACSNLYELSLRIDALHAFDEDIMQELHSLSGRAPLASIAALNLMSFGTQSPIPYQLLSVMPGLRYLRLGTELAAPRPSVPCKVKLYELALLRTPLNVTNVSWLLSASEGHLRVLEFRDTPGRSYDPVLSVHGSHLESFRIIRQELRSASIFKFCLNLKELIIYQFSDFIPVQNIPTSVEHLSFRYSAWAKNNTLMPIIDTVKLLPNLRLVSCNKETEKHEHFPKLRSACQKKQVKLCVDAPPIFILDDPVPLRSAPRWKSVANFPLLKVGRATLTSENNMIRVA
ncbi:hypothetical protein QCA50_006688 [Cerrena zonata]|uniref:F-box domain-containing protein n=1 Tax=Cerrena zonata TaxID=2478898 RepID=A0AAW0G9C2_9APHY